MVDFVIASARLYVFLIHMISSIIPSFYASLAAFTSLISHRSVLDAFLMMILNIVSLSV